MSKPDSDYFCAFEALGPATASVCVKLGSVSSRPLAGPGPVAGADEQDHVHSQVLGQLVGAVSLASKDDSPSRGNRLQPGVQTSRSLRCSPQAVRPQGTIPGVSLEPQTLDTKP